MKFIDRSLDSTINLVGVGNAGKRKLWRTYKQKRGDYRPLLLLFYRKIYFLVSNEQFSNLAVYG